MDKRFVIENVVATANLGQFVNLDEISQKLPWWTAEYKPETFPGLVFRLKRPKTVTLIFSTGKLVCTGARSEDDAYKAVRTVVRALRRELRLKLPSKFEVKIQNIVASGRFGRDIDIAKLAVTLPKTMYEPEQFPGAIHRMQEPKVVFLIFSERGNFVCTGAKKTEDVKKAVDALERKIVELKLFRE